MIHRSMEKMTVKGLVILFTCMIVILITSCNTVKVVGWNDIVDSRDGNTLFLKSGSFVVDKSIVLQSGMKVVGNETVLIPSENLDYSLFKINKLTNVSVNGVTIKGRKLENTKDEVYLRKANYNYFVEIFNSKNISITNCKFINNEGTAIKVLDSKGIDFIKNEFENIGLSTYKGVSYSYDGIYLGGKTSISNIKIDSCSFTNIGESFYHGNKPWPNDGDGIQILIDGVAKNIVITNNTFDRCSARGVKIQSGENVLVDNNTFKDGWSAVLMPMLQEIKDITISNNKVYNNTIAFGTDKAGAHCDAVNLNIINNDVDTCVHFFRTSGYSNMRKGLIDNNRIGSVDQFVFSGRFYETAITNNIIGTFATAKHKSWIMAILLNPESNEVTVENNTFMTMRKGTRMMDNRSKNNIVIRNNHVKNKN